ncbi:MAG: hypothetical protein WEB60_08385 [Terrimicrobiaceae bacterium]
MAIAPRPDLLILDEPAANLDVAARREFLDEILELIREGGKTVFFSTHVLTDVERVADSVGILSGGSLVAEESLDDLKDHYARVRLYNFLGPIPQKISGALSLKTANREISAVFRLDLVVRSWKADSFSFKVTFWSLRWPGVLSCIWDILPHGGELWGNQLKIPQTTTGRGIFLSYSQVIDCVRFGGVYIEPQIETL